MFCGRWCNPVSKLESGMYPMRSVVYIELIPVRDGYAKSICCFICSLCLSLLGKGSFGCGFGKRKVELEVFE